MRSLNPRTLSLVIVCLVSAVADRPANAGTPPVVKAPATQPSEFKIQVNDRLLISIKDEIVSARRRVNPSGEIDLPLIGLVAVGDRTPTEAAEIIRKASADAKILPTSEVNVTFDERGAAISIPSGPFQPGDHLIVRVNDLTALGVETSQLLQLDAEGQVSPPLLQNVNVKGMTEVQAKKAIAKAYAAGQIISNAQVTVERISAAEFADAVQKQSAEEAKRAAATQPVQSNK